jgi:hypothetical protein
MIAPDPPPAVANAPLIGVCGAGYCGRPAVAYVSRTVGSSRRVTVIIGGRGEALGDHSPTDLRCFDCVHDEIDTALASTGIPQRPAAAR